MVKACFINFIKAAFTLFLKYFKLKGGICMFKTDTIAAISTATSNSGISIIRISGTDSFNILEKIFMPKKGNVKDFKTHTVHYGEIISDNKKMALSETPNSNYWKCPAVKDLRKGRCWSNRYPTGN